MKIVLKQENAIEKTLFIANNIAAVMAGIQQKSSTSTQKMSDEKGGHLLYYHKITMQKTKTFFLY